MGMRVQGSSGWQSLRTVIAAALLVVATSAAGAADTTSRPLAVALKSVTVSDALAATLRDTYGAGEQQVLADTIRDSLAHELKRRGGRLDADAAVGIEVVIVDAVPTHPTPLQLERQPGLDYLRSRSVGGASLTATLRGRDGQLIDRVELERYAPTLRDISRSGSAWGDADIAINEFTADIVKSLRRHPVE